MPDIWFPYLGIEIDHLNKVAFSIFGIDIAWYGIIIAVGVVCGLLLAMHLAKKSGQEPDMYIDILIFALIFGLIGARIYYVMFSWDDYKDNISEIFNLRNGGLAIYGGVIAAVLTVLVYSKIKKKNFAELLDTCMPGLALGQAIGRWGNFFNQECFGGYTDNIFAMRLNVETAAYTTNELLQHAVTKGGVKYIQVHPTFLYESFGCLCLVILMVILFKHRKFKGEILFTYMIGYGVIRACVESLRTDQLLIWNTNIPVSVVVSVVMAAAGLILMVVFAVKYTIRKKAAALTTNEYAPDVEIDDGLEETGGESEEGSAEEDSEEDTESKENGEDTAEEVVPADDVAEDVSPFEMESDAPMETESESGSESGSESESETDSDSDTEPVFDTGPESDENTDSDKDEGSEEDTQSESDPDKKSETPA